MKVFIRKWNIDDAPALVNILNNKKIQDNLTDGIPFPFTIDDAKNEIRNMEKLDPNSYYRWAIIAEDSVAGRIRITRKENVHRYTAELGYDIAENFWGKGITTSAVKQVCDYIFNNTDIVRIFAQPYEFNIASCKVLEKAGFTFESSMKKNAYKNGAFVATQMYSIVR